MFHVKHIKENTPNTEVFFNCFSLLPLLVESKKKHILICEKNITKSVIYAFNYLSPGFVAFWSCFKYRPVKTFPSFDHQIYLTSKNKCDSLWHDVSVCVVEKELFNAPILSKEKPFIFKINSKTQYDELLSFLSHGKYRKENKIKEPGDYLLRGGVIDFYPYNSSLPVRCSFLGKETGVYMYDLGGENKNKNLSSFNASAFSDKKGKSIKEKTSKNDVVVFVQKNKIIYNYKKNEPSKKPSFSATSFDYVFYKKNINKIKFIESDKLETKGCCLGEKKYFIPTWYTKGPPKHKPPLLQNNLLINSLYIHEDYGVCLYVGVDNSVNSSFDRVCFKFKDGIIRLDVRFLDKITFFSSKKTRKLDTIGKRGGWKKRRLRYKAMAESFVEKTFTLYSKRERTTKKPLAYDKDLCLLFFSGFKHQPTLDQKKSIDEVFADMLSKKPMSRLLCGDVGFGKTEVALRAAFLAATNNKNVCVLAPTTVLVDQLLDIFKKRFSPFAVNVVSFSRGSKSFLWNKRNTIAVGTHGILNQADFLLSCSLFIVDEEHRFGVKHKDFLLTQNSKCDILYMSATPLPRTLQLSLSHVRPISTIQTPPVLKKKIITHIYEHSVLLIKNIITHEIERGGQVYFVDKSVSFVLSSLNIIKKIFPFASVKPLYSALSPSTIKKTMNDFRNKKIDVLITTSIIESGIDIGNATSIIINNADCFGLSQLYQLRGRVGRGGVQSYAYMLLPSGKKITNNAERRLESIRTNQPLGSGYQISVDDLNIRGAGSLFGFKQSGSSLFGFELYSKLLSRAFNKSIRPLERASFFCFFNLPGCFIPGEYIPNQNERIEIYWALANSLTLSDCDDVFSSTSNLFGPPPSAFVRLIERKKLELLSRGSLLKRVDQNKNCFVCVLRKKPLKSFNLFFNNKSIVFEFSKTTLKLKFQLKKTSKDVYILLSLLVEFCK